MEHPVTPTIPSRPASDSKAEARWRAEEARLIRRERKQARRWRVQYQRPGSILVASLSLSIGALFVMMAAPFLSVHERQNTSLLLEKAGPILVPLMAAGAVLLLLGIFIGQARSWARWGFALVGGGAVALLSFPEPSGWAILAAGIWLFYLCLLFNPEANRFYR